MADAFDQFETLLRESISPSVVDLTLDTDDAIWAVIGTFQPEDMGGAVTNRGGGFASTGSEAGLAGWEASWRVRRQRGGRVTGGTFNGTTLTQMGPDSDLNMGQAANELYLDPAETQMRSYFSVRMKLKRIKGQLTANRDQLNARMISEPLEDVVAEYVEDATFQVRQHITSHFWGDGTGSLGQFGAAGTVYEAAGSVTDANSIVLKSGSTPFRFVIGQQYEVGDNEVATAGKYTAESGNPKMRCVNIDVDNRKAWFQAEAGDGDITIADGDHILVSGNYDFTQSTHALASKASEGIESLVAASGTFPGTNHDITKKAELMGFVEGNESAQEPPTPEHLAKIIDKMTDANKEPPPVMIAEQSLWTYYSQLERQAGVSYPVPQGGSFTANGGVDGPNFSHGGRTFARLSSAQCRTGTVHGITPSTWKKFMPMGNATVKWATSQGGVSGAPSVFRPIVSGRQLTEQMAADFDVFCQFGCTDPRRNFRRIGFLTQRDV